MRKEALKPDHFLWLARQILGEERRYEDSMMVIEVRDEQTEITRKPMPEHGDHLSSDNPVTMAKDNNVYRHHGEHIYLVSHMCEIVRRQGRATPFSLDEVLPQVLPIDPRSILDRGLLIVAENSEVRRQVLTLICERLFLEAPQILFDAGGDFLSGPSMSGYERYPKAELQDLSLRLYVGSKFENNLPPSRNYVLELASAGEPAPDAYAALMLDCLMRERKDRESTREKRVVLINEPLSLGSKMYDGRTPQQLLSAMLSIHRHLGLSPVIATARGDETPVDWFGQIPNVIYPESWQENWPGGEPLVSGMMAVGPFMESFARPL